MVAGATGPPGRPDDDAAGQIASHPAAVLGLHLLNAEMWQVANDFTLPFFATVAAVLVTLGTLFVTISVRRLAVDLARFSSWSDLRSRCVGTPVESVVPGDSEAPPDSPPLSRGARLNVSLLLFVAQAIQIRLGPGGRSIRQPSNGEASAMQWLCTTA